MKTSIKEFITKASFWLMWVLLGRVVIIYFDENNKLAIKLYFSIYDKSFIVELVIASIIATFWTYLIFYWQKNQKQ